MYSDTNEVLDSFFNKLECDDEFFAYYGVDEEEALGLAKERAGSYLKEAMLEFKRRGHLEFELAVDEDTGEFVEPISDDEVDILSEIMLLKYYQRGLAKLKPKLNVFSSTELSLLHSPANERTSYNEMVKTFQEHIRELVSYYVGTDRLTGERKLIDHTISEDEE